jgi:hypothetical protein
MKTAVVARYEKQINTRTHTQKKKKTQTQTSKEKYRE